VVRSSNYTLYGDMSARVMRVISDFTPNLEIYSIDEVAGLAIPRGEFELESASTWPIVCEHLANRVGGSRSLMGSSNRNGGEALVPCAVRQTRRVGGA